MTDWGGSLDQLAHSATFPAWVAVCAAALFALVFLLSLLRAERNLANGALAALTFTGLAIAASIGLRSNADVPAERVASSSVAGLPALACIDDMAGETALAACESLLFGAPDTVAAAVAYTTARINRLVALSSAAHAGRMATADEQALRNAVERDRYGLVAYVLAARDKCRPNACAAFAAMTDHNQIASNMEGLIYEGLVARYAPTWAANLNTMSQPPGAAWSSVSGKPSSVDFPTAASIPPISIMNEPASPRGAPASTMPGSQPSETPSSTASQGATGGPYVPAGAESAPRRRAQPKRVPEPVQGADGPVRLTPPQPQ